LRCMWEVNVAIDCEKVDCASMEWINPLNAKPNPICHLLALLGAHRILHVSRVRVNWVRSHTLLSIFLI